MLLYATMALHGIAVGITGSSEKPVFHLNVVKQHDSKRIYTPADPQLIKELSFEKPRSVDLKNESEIKCVLSDFLRIVSEVVQLQSKEADKDKNKQVVIIVGTDGRQQFQPLLLPLLSKLLEVIKEQGASSIRKLLDKVIITPGAYNEGTIDQEGDFASSDNSEADRIYAIYQSSTECQEYNSRLLELKNDIKNNDNKAILEACEIARTIGTAFGLTHKTINTRFALLGALLKHHKELSKLALYDFVSWHPRIKFAFREAYAQHQGSDKTVVVKGINESFIGPFVDVISCYIHDIFHKGRIDFDLDHEQLVRELNDTIKGWIGAM